MADRKRFTHLEHQHQLPPEVKSAISKLNRFHHLEIGAAKAVVDPGAQTSRLLCAHCSKPNEAQRDLCWACFKPVRPSGAAAAKPAEGQEIGIMLDGVSYTSSQPNLPEKVRVLMDWIRKEGYSPELLTKWQKWVKTQKSAGEQKPKIGSAAPSSTLYQVEAVKGQRGSVLRIDGKIYQSDAPQLPPAIKEIFGYIERDGVTPELMDHLRLFGTSVKYRPISTPLPSDGDVNFWGEVHKMLSKRKKGGSYAK